ncbi:unnamed protein product [Camellia sinensis]
MIVWILKEMIRIHQHFMLWILKEQIRIHQHFMTSMELACVHRNQVSQKGRRNGKKTVLNVPEIDGGLLGPIGPLGFGIYDDLLGPPIDGVYPGLLAAPISPLELDFGLLDAPNDPPAFEKIMKNWALSEASEDNRSWCWPTGHTRLIHQLSAVVEINGGLLNPIGPLGFGVYTDLLGPPIDG